jgi:hypothetical protein
LREYIIIRQVLLLRQKSSKYRHIDTGFADSVLEPTGHGEIRLQRYVSLRTGKRRIARRDSPDKDCRVKDCSKIQERPADVGGNSIP